jgi:hypothetical protein
MARTTVETITSYCIDIRPDDGEAWPDITSRTGRPMRPTRLYVYVSGQRSEVSCMGLRMLHRGEVGRAPAEAPWRELADLPAWARALVQDAMGTVAA